MKEIQWYNDMFRFLETNICRYLVLLNTWMLEILHFCVWSMLFLLFFISKISYTSQLLFPLTEQYDLKVINSKTVRNCFDTYLMEWEQKKFKWVLVS